jgi:hypothetical protein
MVVGFWSSEMRMIGRLDLPGRRSFIGGDPVGQASQHLISSRAVLSAGGAGGV